MTIRESLNQVVRNLEKQIEKHEKEEARIIDERIKNEKRALDALTKAETRSLERKKTISDFQNLVNEFIINKI